MFILKDIFKIGSSSRSNNTNTSHTENLQMRKQGNTSSVLDKGEFVLEENKNKKIHCWLSRESKNKNRNINDNFVRNTDYISNDNKKNERRDSKKKQYEDFRHIKGDCFKEASVNLRNMEFEDLEGLYCNHEQNFESVKNNVRIKFNKVDERKAKRFEGNCINTRQVSLKENILDHNEETTETSKEDSSVDEEELTPTPESFEDETQMDSDNSFSDFSDYSSTAVVVYPGKISEGKNNPNKIIHKKNTPQPTYEKKINSKKCRFESSGYKRKYDTYYVEDENRGYCVCPSKRMRNLKISSENIKLKRKYNDSNNHQHKQSTVRTSSTDPFRNTRRNPIIPANRRVVVIKRPSSLTRPKRYVENDYSKHKRTDYLLIPSGKTKFQRSRFTTSGLRTRKNQNLNYQTSSSSDVSSENDVFVDEYKLPNNLLKRDVRGGYSKNNSLAERIKQNQNKNLMENERQSNANNMNDILHKTQNHHDNVKRKEENMVERQGTISKNNNLPPTERNIPHTNSLKNADFIEKSNKKYENKTILNNRNEIPGNRAEKRYTKKSRHDRNSKKYLESKQNIFVEKGIGEPNYDKKITAPKEENVILQNIIDINNEEPFNEDVTNYVKIKKEQSPSPTTTKKNNDSNNRKSDKDQLISKINRLKKTITDTTQSSRELQNVNDVAENSHERKGKQRSRTRTETDALKKNNNEISKTKKSKHNNKYNTLLENMTSDFTTTEMSNMNKSEKRSSSEARQKDPLPYSNNISATYVLLNTKGNIKNKSFNENKQDESSWELSETKKDRNLELFKLLEEMLGRRKAKRSKPKNIHTVSAVSLAVTKKERTIYKELHKNILKHYRASTSTSGVTFSKTNKPIGKNSGTKKYKTRINIPTNNTKRNKITKPKLEISILPGIEISPSTMRVMQNEIIEKSTPVDNNCCLNTDDTKNKNSRPENEQKHLGRRPNKYRTSRKIDNNNQQSESANDFSLVIQESHTEPSTVHFPPESQSYIDNYVNDEKNPLSRSIGDISKSKRLSANSSLLVLNLSDSKDDIESKEWFSNKLKSSKSSRENMIKTGQTVNDYKTFEGKIFSGTPTTNRNPPLYPSTIKIEVKDVFRPGTVIPLDVTESKAAAPATPSGDTLLLTFTDSEIWGNNIKEEKTLTEKEQQEERSDSTEMIKKLEISLQKSIVQDLKNCSRLSEKSISSSHDSTLNTSETQRCMEEWENLVKRKVLQQLRRKVSTYCKQEITVSPILNQYSTRLENYAESEKTQDKKENTEADYRTNQNILADMIGKKSDLENKNQKSKKRSNLSMSPLETVFEAEEHPAEVIEVELLKESSSFTQMRIFKNVESDMGKCESKLKDFEDKISKLRNLNDLEDMEEEINNFLGNCSLNLQISIDNNDINSMCNDNNKTSNEGDDISEKLMNIYSFNISKNNNKDQTQENTITIENPATIQTDYSTSGFTSTEFVVDPKLQEEKEEDEKCKFENAEISECQSNSCVPEYTDKSNGNSTKIKGNKKIFSRLPVYVKKVKDFKGSLFSSTHQTRKSIEPSKAFPIDPISKEVENKKEGKCTQDEGTNCNLIITKKVDNTINTEVQETKDQTTNYETKLRDKQNKSVSCDFHENAKRYHGLLPNRNKVKDVISNCLKKYRITNFNKQHEDLSKSENQDRQSICSDSSQFTTSTESLYIGENSDIGTYHSRTEKECQTTCIQNFTTDETYADKKQEHNSFPDHSRSQRFSNCSDFTCGSKTIESGLLDLSITTYSTFNEEHDGVLQCQSEDTPNRLISVLDEKIKMLSKQKGITKCANSTKDDATEFMKTPKLSDDDPMSPGQCFLEKQNRNNHKPKQYYVTKTKNSFSKLKPTVTYNLTKENSAFCNLRPNLNISKTTSQKYRLKNKVDNKIQMKEEMNMKNLSSFQKRKLYWESLRKPEKKCTFAINTKKSKYVLMLSGKDKKKGSGKRRGTSFFERTLKPSEPSIFFKPLSKPINQRKQHNNEVESKDGKIRLNQSLSPKVKTIDVLHPSFKTLKKYPTQYEDTFIRCSRCAKVRHSSSLISIRNKTNGDEQNRPSSADSKRSIFKERLPTFYSYNFWNEESINNRNFNCHSSDSIVENNETKLPLVDNFKLRERKSFMDSVADLDFVQNYDISELCNGNMDLTSEKQFVNKVKKRAKELFKNFMDELNADFIVGNKVEKGTKSRSCICENNRLKGTDSESFAGNIYDDNKDLITKKSFSESTKVSQEKESNTHKKTETYDQGDNFNSKSKISTNYVEEHSNKYKESYEIISANTSGDTNITSFDEYESSEASVYQLHKPITLARAEVAPYPNYVYQSPNIDFTQRFNNDGDVINENQNNANLIVDDKVNSKQVYFNKENNCHAQTLKSFNEIKFDFESFDGDLYNSESEINFTPSVDVTVEASSRSLNSKKILSTIHSISHVDDQNGLSADASEKKENAAFSLKSLTEKVLKETVEQTFDENPPIMKNITNHDNDAAKLSSSNTLMLLKSVNQNNRLKIRKSFDSLNGEAFRPSESSYFSSDIETVKQHVTDVNQNYSGNNSESFDESNENFSQTDVSTSSTSQTNDPYLIIKDCIISDEDKFLQDFTETSSFASSNSLTKKQDECDSKSDSSNLSNIFSHHAVLYDNTSADAKVYTSGITVERKTTETDDSDVTNSTGTPDIYKDSPSFNLLNSFEFETNNSSRKEKDDNEKIKLDRSSNIFFTINENDRKVENQDYYSNSKSDNIINATKIYESPVDPLFSSIRVYHEKPVTNTTKRSFQGECSTFYSNQKRENSTTSLKVNKDNDETVLDEFAMTLTSYESSPNLCLSQNQNETFGINTNSRTSKLTPEEMDSGFESTKHKTNTQRWLVKTVSTSDLQDFNTSVNSVQESRSSHSMFACVSSSSVAKNFFHNVQRKTSRKKKHSLTALSRSVQLQRRSSIHLNQSIHWKEFWKNVRQIRDNSSKQTTNDDILKGNVRKCKETLTDEKHLFFDSLIHLKDFHFENTYLSYSLFELENDQMNKTSNNKCFPTEWNRNFLTYNVYVPNRKERKDKATQTKQDVYFIPYVSVIAVPNSSTTSTLQPPQQTNLNPDTAKSNSQSTGSSSCCEKRKPAHMNLKKAPERTETSYSDLEEIRQGRRPYRKKKTKRTEENADVYDVMSVDDSGCGTFSSEKSYKIPKRLNIETFQGHDPAAHADFKKDNLASIEECRSSFQYLVTTSMKAASNSNFANENWDEPSLDTNQSPRSNVEDEPLFTSENEYEAREGASTSWRIRDSENDSINEPSSSSTTLNRDNVGTRKLRKRSNKTREKYDSYSFDGNKESLRPNGNKDQNPFHSLPTQQNVNKENNVRLQRPLLTFVNSRDQANISKKKNKINDNIKCVEPKGPHNRIPNISGISRIPQRKLNIVVIDTNQQITRMLKQGQPTVVLQNKVQSCNCMKKMIEIRNPQTSEEIEKIHQFYEVVGCFCGSKKVTDKVVEDQIEIEDELSHAAHNIDAESVLHEISESHLLSRQEPEVINKEPSKQLKPAVLPKVSDKEQVIIQNEMQPCSCLKKMMEIVNPQTEEEIERIYKFYEIVGCSCGSKKGTDQVVENQIDIEDELSYAGQKTDEESALYEISESYLHKRQEPEVINEEPSKLVKRTTLTKVSDTEQVILQNEVQPCSCLKNMMEIADPQAAEEIEKIHQFYEIVGCSCSSKKGTDKVVEIEDELSLASRNIDADLVLYEIGESHLHMRQDPQVINKEPPKQLTTATLRKVSEKEQIIPQNEVQSCSCLKKMMEIVNPQTEEEIERIYKFYEIVGCSCGSKKGTDKVVEGQIEIEDELDHYTHNLDAGPALDEIEESHFHGRRESEMSNEEFPKLVKRTTLLKISDTEEQTTKVIDYEETPIKKHKKKEASHCLMSETELIKQQNNKEHDVRSSLTDKEIFEKLLASYEKEDKIIRELSHGDDFMEFQPTVEDRRQSTLTFEEPEHNHSELKESKLNIFEETKSKKYKRKKSLERKGIERSSDEIDQKEVESLKMEDSQTFETNAQHRRTRFFSKKKPETKNKLIDRRRSSNLLTDGIIEKDREVFKSKKTKLNERISFSSNEDLLKAKRGDAKTITEDDIIQSKELGKCFRRGFRPDSTTLSGDPCLSLSPEEEATRLNTLQTRQDSMIEFSERGSPLEYLLRLGFSIDEASNAIKNEDVKHRLYAAITEARIWVNHINANQGTLLYLAAYKTKPNTMRYFLQLIEAIINGRINDAVKLDAFIRLLERVEDGEISIVKILGFDQFEDEVNEEIILRKQLRQLFVTIFKIAEKEAKLKGRALDKDTIELLRILAARYRAGLHPHLELIARYIGQGLLVNEIQLEAAMIYLSRLDTADVNLSQFEKYCSITCGKKANKDS